MSLSLSLSSTQVFSVSLTSTFTMRSGLYNPDRYLFSFSLSISPSSLLFSLTLPLRTSPSPSSFPLPSSLPLHLPPLSPSPSLTFHSCMHTTQQPPQGFQTCQILCFSSSLLQHGIEERGTSGSCMGACVRAGPQNLTAHSHLEICAVSRSISSNP